LESPSLVKSPSTNPAHSTLIEEFIAHLWSGPREPARIYIQESGLPLLMTMASDGTYLRSMRSTDEMEQFVLGLSREFDGAANMDW
jgi:hypothetical protein